MGAIKNKTVIRSFLFSLSLLALVYFLTIQCPCLLVLILMALAIIVLTVNGTSLILNNVVKVYLSKKEENNGTKKKSVKADLEQYRLINTYVGIIMSLVIIFLFLEWDNCSSSGAFAFTGGVNIDDELIIEVPPTRQKKKVPPPPIITVVPEKEKEVIDEPILLDTEIGSDEPIEIEDPPIEPQTEPDIIWVAEVDPEFPGGTNAMYKYLYSKIVYPQIAVDNVIEGKVFISFIVDKKGNLRNFKILRGIGGGCEEEAVRVIKGMPNWNPGLQNGRAVNVPVTLRIKFTLVK
ncbi:MAG: hypothetical protein COC01_06070 [Bacteroidetes bacterium]|nr:MAG: hypothetical protein COC01_06070 [Bacteroidota bacterium]